MYIASKVRLAIMLGIITLIPSVLCGQSNRDVLNKYVTQDFEFLNDIEGTIPPSSIFSGERDTAFTPITSDKVSIGFTRAAIWLKTDLSNLEVAADFIEFTDPYISSISMYVTNHDGKVDSVNNGVVVPVTERDFKTGRIAFEIPDRQDAARIYFRIQSIAPVNLSVAVYSTKSWYDSENDRSVLFVIFSTLFLLVAIASLLLWFMRRQPLFLYHIGFVFCFAAAALHNFGFAQEIAEIPLAERIVPTLISLSLVCLLGMYKSLLSMLSKPYSRLRKYLGLGILFFAVCAFANLLSFGEWIIQLILAMLPLATISLIVISVVLRKEKSRGLLLFSLGCIVFLFAFATRTLGLFGAFTMPDVITLFPIIFLIIQMVFFLLGLFHQSNIYQKALLQTQSDLKQSLAMLEWHREKLKPQMLSEKSNDNERRSRSLDAVPDLGDEELNHLLVTPLSPRELEVLQAISKGMSNREAAEALYISVNTVKTHLLRIYEKLDVSNRTEAAIRAGEMNLFG